MLVSGAVGTGLAMLGITDHFIEFLEWLGVIVPPIAGIYLVDYFLLDNSDSHRNCAPPSQL